MNKTSAILHSSTKVTGRQFANSQPAQSPSRWLLLFCSIRLKQYILTDSKLSYFLSCLTILFFLDTVAFCQGSEKNKIKFHTETKSSIDVKVIDENCTSINYKKIDYEILYLKNSQFKSTLPYIAKYETNVSLNFNSEKPYLMKHKVSVYDINKNKPIIAFAKAADTLTFKIIHNDFYVWEAYSNSCCNSPDTVEVLDVMGKRTLVTSINKYYTIINDKTSDTYLFGFTGMGYKGYKAGYFGTINYSINQKSNKTIRIKVDTSTNQYYEHIFNRKPEVSFNTLSNDSAYLIDSTKERNACYKISNNSIDNIKKINNVGLRFTYYDYWVSDGIYKKATYDLLIKEGEINEKEIFLKFE